MLSLLNKANLPNRFAVLFLAFALVGINSKPAPAQERYPAVARLSFVSGPVSYSRGDDPDEWDDAIENVPLTIGDRIYSPEDGRAELQLSSGNFVRLAPRSYLSALNLGDDIKQFYLGEGTASFNIRRLEPDEVIEIDTPNVSVTFDEPGRYRVSVDEDGNSRITVRRGRVSVAASGRQIAVENSEIRIYGIESPRYEIVGLPATDAFDQWASERDDRFDRSYSNASRYASEDILGVEDLSEYGRWEEIPEYGYAWTPSRVAAGWLPFSDGRWFWQDPWGWTWISNERWGWATSHYGRWTPYRSRWYWVPIRPRTRVRYAPAVVEFVRVRDHVGWFPLHPRDRYIPWWDRRDRRNITYVNRTHVTIVNQNNFISARPVNKYIVRDSVLVREASSGRFASESLPIPTRSSLRVVSETAGRRGHKPSANVLNRAAVVRTAPPAPPPTFREKLPEIQKTQGRPVAPSAALALESKNDKARAERIRIRPAAEETKGGAFAARTPGAASGPAPQPLTAARGKKLATRENPVDTNVSERAERVQKSPAPQQPAQSPTEPSKGSSSKAISPKPEPERERGRQEKQTLERPAQQTPQKQEPDRKLQEQQKAQERKAQLLQQQKEQERREQLRQQQLQKQQQEQERPKELQPRQSREQQRLEELERRQTLQREEERKSQQQRHPLPQERQAQQQKEQDRKAQLQQQQQEQARREQQLRQQQAQERQVRDQQRQQQEVERRQQQQQREQERNVQSQQRQEQARAQQLRQQQAQAQREAQQAQRQQEQERRPQPRPQPQQQERPVPQAPRQPGQF
jgi:uncharacterized protein DUF6600/FecR-like protein